jgi:hypothetical protein
MPILNLERKRKEGLRSYRCKPIEYKITDTGCWECTSHSYDRDGYPKLERDGYFRMNRWIYSTVHDIDIIGNKLKVCHTCDNPSCINPDHLWLEEKTGDNERDRDAKGRTGPRDGVNNGNSKLTKLDIEWIKMWLSLGFKQRVIAEAFNVIQSTISHINMGRTWNK